MNVKITFTIPEELTDELQTVIAKSQRRCFVANVVTEKLRAVKEERLLSE